MLDNSIYSNIINWLLNSNSDLVDLDLSYSTIVGTINPSQLKNLTTLNYLYLDAQMIRNNFEWLPHLSSLTDFELDGANFNNDSLLTFQPPPSLSTLIISYSQFPKVESVLYRSFPNSSNFLTSLSMYDSTVHPTAITWLMNSSTNLVHLAIYNCSIDGNQIPKSLGNLTKLQTLDLEDNQLNGTLQDLFESFSGCLRNSLRALHLSRNLLEGRLPVHSLSSLAVFDASYNRLSGNLTESIGQLHSLEIFSVASNSLTGVVSEVHFEKLSKLKELDLSSNSLTLSFNSNWVPPFQLTAVGLGSCKLGPQFPGWLRSQLNLFFLDISNSGISGAIPNWFYNITFKLDDLDLSSNQINGTLQNFPFVSMHHVNFSSNQFHGSVPPSLSKASELYLSNNLFNNFSSFLCDITDGATKVLDLSNNQLFGSLPNCWWNLKDLVVIKLDNNELSGAVPSSMSLLYQMSYLNLWHNNFSGTFSSLKNCTNLQVLDVRENNWEGEIPTWIGESLVNLVFLRLKSNRFQGSIPSNLCNLQFLQILDLSDNNVSGIIPSCIHNFTSMVQDTEQDEGNMGKYIMINFLLDEHSSSLYLTTEFIIWKGVEYKYEEILGLLRIIDLSSNRLTGEIPRELENLVELVQLNLSRNNLSGAIPMNIGRLSKIESLDLSHNKLSGNIPVSITQVFTLDYLDLSNNQLSGRIPTSTQLQSLNASAYAGNVELCGQPLTTTCPVDQTLDSDGNEESNIEDNGEWFDMSWFRIGIGVGFAVGFFGVCGNLLLRTSWRIAYFRFLNKFGDWIYVIAVVKWATLKRWLSN